MCLISCSQAGIKSRDKQLHPTVPVGSNYLSLPLIPVSCTTLLIYPESITLKGGLRGGAPRLKSPASRLFTQRFVKAQIKENIKAPRHWPL